MKWFSKAVLGAVLLVGLATNGYSQSGLGFFGIGGKLGLVDPENIDSVIGFGVFGDFGEIAENIRLEGNLDYWSKSYGSGDFDLSISDLAFTGTVKYVFPTSNEAFRPFAAGGLGVHFVKGKGEYKGSNPYLEVSEYSDTKTKIGIDLGGGVFYGISEKVDLLGELRYRLVSDVNQLTLQIGAMYKLGD